MAIPVNDALLHAAIDHSIDQARYSSGVIRRIIAILNKADSHLFLRLTDALEQMPPDMFSVQRLESLLAEVRDLNARAYATIRQNLESELADLVRYEIGYQQQLFAHVLPVQVGFASVSVETAYVAAMARPFQGRLLSEWAAGIESDRMARIRDTIRIGFVEGQTVADMVRQLRGTQARGFEDGIIQIDRRNAESIVRTAVSHTANFARQRFYEGNSGLIKGLRWVATLDGRTSPICRARDGKVFPVNSGPRPPAHWGCRSTTAPVLKSWRELGIDMAEMPQSTRASMDGQVPGDMNYGQWLGKQSAARQDEILGVSRGKLFREGMGVDRFVDNKGRTLTIDELRRKDAETFRKAGI